MLNSSMKDQDIDVVKKFCVYTLLDSDHKIQLTIFSEFEKQILSILYSNPNPFSGLLKLSWFYEQVKVHQSSLPEDNIVTKIHSKLTQSQRSILLCFIRSFDTIIERKEFDRLETLNEAILIPLSNSYTQFFTTLDQQIIANTTYTNIFYIYTALMFIRLQKYFISQNWYCFGKDIEKANMCFEYLIGKVDSVFQLYTLSPETPKILKLLYKSNEIYLKHYLIHLKNKGYNCADINLGIVTIKLALAAIFA